MELLRDLEEGARGGTCDTWDSRTRRVCHKDIAKDIPALPHGRTTTAQARLVD
ncbi:hypothetical protein GCM10009832_30740 [Dietzia kunjamensis subsp. schimae]